MALKGKNTTLQGFQLLPETNEIFLFVKALVEKGKSDIFVIRLNDQGEKEETFNLTKDIEENIVDVTASPIGEGKYIFTGTYSKTSTSTSQGMYFCKTENDQVEFIEFYSFLDLEKFLSYLSEKRQEKIEKKKKKKGKKERNTS